MHERQNQDFIPLTGLTGITSKLDLFPNGLSSQRSARSFITNPLSANPVLSEVDLQTKTISTEHITSELCNERALSGQSPFRGFFFTWMLLLYAYRVHPAGNQTDVEDASHDKGRRVGMQTKNSQAFQKHHSMVHQSNGRQSQTSQLPRLPQTIYWINRRADSLAILFRSVCEICCIVSSEIVSPLIITWKLKIAQLQLLDLAPSQVHNPPFCQMQYQANTTMKLWMQDRLDFILCTSTGRLLIERTSTYQTSPWQITNKYQTKSHIFM